MVSPLGHGTKVPGSFQVRPCSLRSWHVLKASVFPEYSWFSSPGWKRVRTLPPQDGILTKLAHISSWHDGYLERFPLYTHFSPLGHVGLFLKIIISCLKKWFSSCKYSCSHNHKPPLVYTRPDANLWKIAGQFVVCGFIKELQALPALPHTYAAQFPESDCSNLRLKQRPVPNLDKHASPLGNLLIISEKQVCIRERV